MMYCNIHTKYAKQLRNGKFRNVQQTVCIKSLDKKKKKNMTFLEWVIYWTELNLNHLGLSLQYVTHVTNITI